MQASHLFEQQLFHESLSLIANRLLLPLTSQRERRHYIGCWQKGDCLSWAGHLAGTLALLLAKFSRRVYKAADEDRADAAGVRCGISSTPAKQP